MGVGFSPGASLRFLVIERGAVVRQELSWRSRTIGRPRSRGRGKEVCGDYVAIILQNHFWNNAGDLLLTEDSRLLRILLRGLRMLAGGGRGFVGRLGFAGTFRSRMLSHVFGLGLRALRILGKCHVENTNIPARARATKGILSAHLLLSFGPKKKKKKKTEDGEYGISVISSYGYESQVQQGGRLDNIRT